MNASDRLSRRWASSDSRIAAMMLTPDDRSPMADARKLALPKHHWTRVERDATKVHSREWSSFGSAVSRPPVVLVAGLGCSSSYWVRLGPRLARTRRVLAPDLPGFGRSKKSKRLRWPGGPGVREQADQLLAWMDALGIQRAVLCGHSVGCQTAVDLAVRFPGRVDTLILAAPTYEQGHRTLASHIPRLLLGAFVEATSLTPLLIFEYLSAGLPRVLQQAVRTMADPIESKLPRVAAPTLVIRGRLDPLVRQPWAETVTTALPHASLVVIDGVGHAVQYSSSAVMADVVDDFLNGRFEPALIVPRDDPRIDPLGPRQPISPRVHRVLDGLLVAATLVAPRLLRWDAKSRRQLTIAALANAANSLATVTPQWPMIAHANTDWVLGLSLLAATSKSRSGQPVAARGSTLALGLYHVLSATLTAKPTGPACLVEHQRKPASEVLRRPG